MHIINEEDDTQAGCYSSCHGWWLFSPSVRFFYQDQTAADAEYSHNLEIGSSSRRRPQLPLHQWGSLTLISLWAGSSCVQTSWSRSRRRSRPRRCHPGIYFCIRLRCTRHRWDWLGRKRCTTSLLYGNGRNYLLWGKRQCEDLPTQVKEVCVCGFT